MDPETGSRDTAIRHSIIYLIPLFVNNLLPLITLPIFSRILTPQDYGVFALAQAYGMFVSGIGNLGMTAAYERNYFQFQKDRRKTGELLFSSLVFAAGTFVLLGLLTYVFRDSVGGLLFGSTRHGAVLMGMYAASAATLLSVYFYTYLRNAGMAERYVMYTIAGNVLAFAVSMYLVAYLRIGILGLVYSQMIAAVAALLAMTWFSTRILPVSIAREPVAESLKMSYPLTPRVILGTIDNQFDKYMVGALGSLGELGVYRISQQIASVVFVGMTQLEQVFNPGVYRKMFEAPEGDAGQIGRYLTPFAYVSVGVAVTICLFSEEVLTALTPEAFHGVVDVIAILCVYSAFLFFGKIMATQLMFAKKTGTASLLTMFSLALNIALNIPLIMRFGAAGAALGTLLANVISRAAALGIAHRSYRIIWEYRRILAIYLLLILSAFLAIAMRAYEYDYTVRLSVKVLCLASYLYIGVKIHILSLENASVVRRIFKEMALGRSAK